MERNCSKETKLTTGQKRSIYVSTKISISTLLLSEVGLETRLFENGKASFGRTGPTGQKRTTSGGGPLFPEKFPPGPKRSIYISTEISGNLGIMESTLQVEKGRS